MAKISANGATKVATIKTISPAAYAYTWTLCSDGRILLKSEGEGYRLYYRVKNKNYITAEFLRRFVTQGMKHTIQEKR